MLNPQIIVYFAASRKAIEHDQLSDFRKSALLCLPRRDAPRGGNWQRIYREHTDEGGRKQGNGERRCGRYGELCRGVRSDKAGDGDCLETA